MNNFHQSGNVKEPNKAFLAVFLFVAIFVMMAAVRAMAAQPEPVPVDRGLESPPAPIQSYEIEYSVRVVEQAGQSRLVLDCLLDRSHTESVLQILGDKIYKDNQGQRYDLVVINWRLKSKPDNGLPWAKSNMTRNATSFRMMR